ncbi:MAG: thiamine diphosphokinase [Acidimicrobiales bacterium]|nr:thiamine diphosphokinase [Acidimicrobiales bacterium]
MTDQGPTVVILAGGAPVPETFPAISPEPPFVVAADSGLYLAERYGLPVAVAVGDFDSVDGDTLHRFAGLGTHIDRHPRAKDRTDLELALDHAIRLGAARAVVVAGGGGRLDHLLGNAHVLGSPAYSAMEIEAHFGSAHLHVVRRELELQGKPGEIVGLLALHGPVRGITTDGLRYPLRRESLLPGSTRGLSNEFIAPRASVRVEEGTLLMVRPGS